MARALSLAGTDWEVEAEEAEAEAEEVVDIVVEELGSGRC